MIYFNKIFGYFIYKKYKCEKSIWATLYIMYSKNELIDFNYDMYLPHTLILTLKLLC